MQPEDGVQITWVRPTSRHNYRRFTPNNHDAAEREDQTAAYNRYMATGYREGQNGVNNPSRAYDHYNNAIANFQLALRARPGDSLAQDKLEEFRGYRDRIQEQYDNYMREGWAAIGRGQETNDRQQKIREYNTALINFNRAYQRIATGTRGDNAQREIAKVTGFLDALK